MSNTIEFNADTEQAAVEQACASLGCSAEALEYAVVEESAEQVRISVQAPEEAAPADEAPAEEAPEADEAPAEEPRRRGITGPAPEKVAQAKEVAEALFERIGVKAVVETRDDEAEIVLIVHEAEGSTELAEVFGQCHPPAIPSLQFLLNKIVNRFPDDRKHILLEVPSVPRREREPRPETPRKERAPRAPAKPDPDLDPSLVELAQHLAEKVKRLNKVITIQPMASGDRRALHQTIVGIEGVHTASEGDGLYRRLHIIPSSLGGAPKPNKKRRRRRRRREGGESSAGVQFED